MPSAKVYLFPRDARRRSFPPRPPAPGHYVSRASGRPGPGFGLLLVATLVAAFLYLSGVMRVARHDALYAALLVAVWSCFFASEALLRTRLGPLLRRFGQVLLLGGLASCFGFLYWLILIHP